MFLNFLTKKRLQKLPWIFYSGHTGVSGNEQADRLASIADITSGLQLGRAEVLRGLRNFILASDSSSATWQEISVLARPNPKQLKQAPRSLPTGARVFVAGRL